MLVSDVPVPGTFLLVWPVLILVLVDVGLGHDAELRKYTTLEGGLIRVLVDVGLGLSKRRPVHEACTVLILVLVDVGLGHVIDSIINFFCRS